MIDLFSLFLTHGLIGLAIVRLLMRRDLDAAGENGTDRHHKGVKRKQPGASDA